MCLRVCAYMLAHACVCVLMSSHSGTRGWCQVSSSVMLQLTSWHTVSQWIWSLPFLQLFPRTGITGMNQHTHRYVWGQETGTRVFRLVWQALCSLAISPAPTNPFFSNKLTLDSGVSLPWRTMGVFLTCMCGVYMCVCAYVETRRH